MRKIEMVKCKKCGRIFTRETGGFVPEFHIHKQSGNEKCCLCRVEERINKIKDIIIKD